MFESVSMFYVSFPRAFNTLTKELLIYTFHHFYIILFKEWAAIVQCKGLSQIQNTVLSTVIQPCC